MGHGQAVIHLATLWIVEIYPVHQMAELMSQLPHLVQLHSMAVIKDMLCLEVQCATVRLMGHGQALNLPVILMTAHQILAKMEASAWMDQTASCVCA